MTNEAGRLWVSLTGGDKLRRPADSLFTNEIRKAKHARFIISVFYFIVFTTSVQTFSYFYQFPDWKLLLASRHLFEPLWSSRWVLWFDWEFAVRFILMFYFGGSLLAMIFWERWRWVRVVAFVSIFQYLSLISSFSKIDHYMHLMTITMFMLIFLPDRKSEMLSHQRTLKIIFGIQSFILFTYFISGAFKLLGVVTQEIAGQVSALSPEGLSQHVAKGVFITNTPTFFSALILDHPSWLASIMLITGYCIEVCSIFVIFYPNLHRVWGLIVLVFHSVILMTIGPDFTVQMLVAGLFLVFSPFNSKGIV